MIDLPMLQAAGSALSLCHLQWQTQRYTWHRLWLRATQKRQTSVQPAGKHATWNENFLLPVEVAERQKLVAVLYDHDTIGSDDELGR